MGRSKFEISYLFSNNSRNVNRWTPVPLLRVNGLGKIRLIFGGADMSAVERSVADPASPSARGQAERSHPHSSTRQATRCGMIPTRTRRDVGRLV